MTISATDSPTVDPQRLANCLQSMRQQLLSERNTQLFWEGSLSTSALSTATAVVALEIVRQEIDQSPNAALKSGFPLNLEQLIAGGIRWLVANQNADGGWGDTTKSHSNIATTMLCHAAFYATGVQTAHLSTVTKAAQYIEQAGGIAGLRDRYGADKTFAVPILTHCALSGVVDWREVSPLPFELACLPAEFYKWARLPVVSYALPALIAIGQVRHHFRKPMNPVTRLIRNAAAKKSLAVLERIQPSSGGFLEAAPLTSFVTMSLAGMGQVDHPVVRSAVDFLARSVRPNGSWPIDTNLSTWVTTLSVSAIGNDFPVDSISSIRVWLLGQQYRQVHPYTNADPGGWAWTDLPGGVPDADDTPGAILALIRLESLCQRDCNEHDHSDRQAVVALSESLDCAVDWLLDLQNSNGGWPTFCRGWGKLPFDRSAPDLTAHAIRALYAWRQRQQDPQVGVRNVAGANPQSNLQIRRNQRVAKGIEQGFAYLNKTQRTDGSWLPLWFGNQDARDDENPVYGTTRVLAAYRDAGGRFAPACLRGLEWLSSVQNADGGWGGSLGISSSTEETSLALEVLISVETTLVPTTPIVRGVDWMLRRFDAGRLAEPSPIGFYFAKLWYFEKLYTLIFAVAALQRAARLKF